MSELILNGVLGVEGVQLLGSVLSYLTNTDKQDYVNVPILQPLCQTTLFECTGLVPLSARKNANDDQLASTAALLPAQPTEEHRSAIAKLLNAYHDSLIEHANEVRVKMNTITKSIKRQERTRGTGSIICLHLFI